jgi:uncharacterized membrane protein
VRHRDRFAGTSGEARRWFADLRRRGTLARRSAWGGFVLGLGVFQLFDGIVDHKLLDLHEVRYSVDVLPYDLAWNGAALVFLLVGGFMLWRSGDEGRTRADRR